MNYRHAFHAGNFADVMKHAVLARILTYLHEKPAPFRVIDTHAGAGLYDLASEEAERGGEWQAGIGRVLTADWPDDVAALLAPYLDAVRAFNPQGGLSFYPGSPLITRALLRPDDHLVACEIASGPRASLIDALRRDAQARVVNLDGYQALKAFVPPKERRGLVLVDPPFEQRDEFRRLADGFMTAYRKWPTGIYLLWYPVKEHALAAGLAGRVAAAASKVLRLELSVDTSGSIAGLSRSGLLVINPPWTLARDMARLLPAVAAAMSGSAPSAVMIDPSP